MGCGQGLVGRFDRQEGPQGEAPAGPSRGAQRNPVGVSYRSAVERPPCPLSSLPNMPSLLQSVVQGGCLGQGAIPACLGSARQREDRYHRMLPGRHLRKCQKGGRDIGPTKRGKGTKIMALTDAHGLPIAVRTFSARSVAARSSPNAWWQTAPTTATSSAPRGGSSSSAPIAATGPGRPRRMAGPCAGTAADGRSSASSPGSSTGAEQWSATNTMSGTTWASFNLRAS